MTKEEKLFIENHIHIGWSVQLLFMAREEFEEPGNLSFLPFNSIQEVLDFGDVPFCVPLTDDLALAYLPENSPMVFHDLNLLLVECSSYYLATISAKNADESQFWNIRPDMFLSQSIRHFKLMVRRVKNYMTLQLKPDFDQRILDKILDELKDKSLSELSLLKQMQLKHFSQLLDNKPKRK